MAEQPSLLEPIVMSGAVWVLRLFDVAYEIDLNRVETLLAERDSVSRIRLARAKPKALDFRVQPVGVGLGRIELLGCGEAEVVARLYDFGVVSIGLRFVVPPRTPWPELVAQVNRIDAAAADTPHFTAELDRLTQALKPALVRPSRSPLEEDYLIAAVQTFDQPLEAAILLEQVDLVGLLSGEGRPLAESARRDYLRHSYSYYRDDLVVMTWDRAFVLEPTGDTDVADVLEVANTQLLELRYYDGRLDDELPRMYDRVEGARRGVGIAGRWGYAGLARELHGLVGEVTEVVEKVDNVLKVTEDVYLARVYAAALELFRIRAWASAVDRKLGIVRETYTALNDEAVATRGQILEIAITLLIVVEVILAIWGR